MRIPENKSHAMPGDLPVIRWIHDYELCSSIDQLRMVMETINRNQYQLISVTQDSSDMYTVFFRRCAV